MDSYKLIQAIKELRLAQFSPVASRAVIERYPELLAAETLRDISAKATECRRKGEDSNADSLFRILNALTALRDSIDEESSGGTSNGQPSKLDLTDVNVPWAEAARQYLALRKDADLQIAIDEAERKGEHAIVKVLQAYHEGDIDSVVQITQTENIYPTLQSQGRHAEGYTLNLLFLDLLAARIQFFERYPLSDQEKVVESGIEACFKAISLCDLLDDKPCKAFYIRHVAIGCSEIGHSESAITQFKDALKIYRELAVSHPQEYQELVARTLVNLGVDQAKLGEYEPAVVSYKEAIKIYREFDGAPPTQFYELDLAGVLYRLGSVLVLSKDYEQAILTLNEAIEIYRTSSASPSPYRDSELAEALQGLGVAYSDSREFLKSANAFTKALELRQKLAERNAQAYDAELAMTLNSLGVVQIELRNWKAALNDLNRALEIYQKLFEVSPDKYRDMIALILHNLGVAQDESGQSEQAITSFTEALKIEWALAEYYPGDGYKARVAKTLNSIGSVHLERREFEHARGILQRALNIKQSLAEQSPRLYNRSLVTTLSNLGQVYLFQADWNSALACFKKAEAIIEQLREELQDIDRRRHIFQENLNIYRGLLVCYVNLGAWDKALEMAEQGKSRSLSDLLNLKTLRPKFLLDRAPSNEELADLDELADRYEDAVTQAQQLESLLLVHYQNHSRLSQPATGMDERKLVELSRMRTSLEQEIAKREKQKAQAVAERNRLLQAVRQFDKTFPPRAELLNREQILNISRESNRVIVLFRVDYEGTYIFIVFPNGTLEHQVVPQFNLARLRELTQSWFEPYNKHAELRRAGKDALAHAELVKFIRQMKPLLTLIYRELLKPLHDLLKMESYRQYKDILFVPNNALAVWPLHACCWDENGATQYLLDEYRISYATSVSVFKHAWEHAQQHSRLNKFLFIANPTSDLGNAEKEVNQIIEVLGLAAAQRKEFRRTDARKSAVKETLMKGAFGFYHFSSHGTYNRTDAFSSALTMADGELTLKEIMELNLSAAWLTTLSACETGLVDFNEVTDEHYGFPLGFIFAGCPSVWATLWVVDDKPTAELMQKAYKFLKDGQSTAEALRLAQVAYRKEKETEQSEQNFDYSSPYFWAGFQHYGV